MPRFVRDLPACGALLLVFLMLPATADGHAAFDRSEPGAGTILQDSPETIRIWFTEPLEQTYTGADLLDASGARIAGVTAAIASENAHELVITLPPLADGGYTVAWRTLSAADGHTLEGYFGFQVGEGPTGQTVNAATGSSHSDLLRGLSRSLALLGLAALLAIAPLTLGILDPVANSNPGVLASMEQHLRRYSVLAASLALFGSALALVAQATAIAPGSTMVTALEQTLGDTRYGQIWLIRVALLLGIIALLALAFWARARWRRPMLIAATALSFAAPIPFSKLSHAAAQQEGSAAAVAADALHLLAASVWAGGLFVLVVVLLPALAPLPSETRVTILRAAIPRFSVIGLAAWGILGLSGLYGAWLQVGTIEALRESEYGQTLLMKGALLLPVLALAAFHFALGWRGVKSGDATRVARTFVVEALIVVAVLIVVGRLIGLEPAREAVAGKMPRALTHPLSFATHDGERRGQLTISPGIAGANTFTIDIDGAELPADSEGVIRFSLLNQEIGQQELALPATDPNTFRAEGSELTLTGDWQVRVIVRKIGSYSMAADLTVPISGTPPSVPEINPAPRFGPAGVPGMAAIAVGICAIAAALSSRDAAAARRAVVSAAGVAAVIAGSMVLGASRLPESSMALAVADSGNVPATPVLLPVSDATAIASEPPPDHVHDATPRPERQVAAAGTPVAIGDLIVMLDYDAGRAGPTDVIVLVTNASGMPVSGARVALVSEMSGMSGRTETVATEPASGRYLAADVPLSMAGEWRLTVRVSPKGEPSQVVPFVVTMP